MNKPTMSDSDKRLLIIFCAVLIVAAAYFFVFNKCMSKASEIEEQNTTDAARVQELEIMEASLPEVREQIEQLKATQEEIIAKYPSELPTEKVIYVLQSMEDACDVHFSDVSFSMDTPMQTVTATTETTDTTDDTTGDTAEGSTAGDTAEGDTAGDTASGTAGSTAGTAVAGYYNTIDVKYDSSYEGLKELIAFVNEYDDRMTITACSAAYDSETGRLTGDLTIAMYYLTGTGREYEEPTFDGSSAKGVDNIFGGAEYEQEENEDGDQDENEEEQ